MCGTIRNGISISVEVAKYGDVFKIKKYLSAWNCIKQFYVQTGFQKLFNKGDFGIIFQDNVVKEYLKNVYFITRTPCGGKTTISRELAKRHNFLVYDVDEQFAKHQKISNAVFQPSMNKVFKDADEFSAKSNHIVRLSFDNGTSWTTHFWIFQRRFPYGG